jgi:hypothetical protein
VSRDDRRPVPQIPQELALRLGLKLEQVVKTVTLGDLVQICGGNKLVDDEWSIRRQSREA